MFKLSKCLYNAMAEVQCETPYSDMNICLCPDRLSFSLLEYIYYENFSKKGREIKSQEFNTEIGYYEVIFEKGHPVCRFGSASKFINFREANFIEGLKRFAELSLTEQTYLSGELSMLLTMRLKFQSGEVLYEDAKAYMKSDFLAYEVAEFAMAILDKILDGQNCEKEVLMLIEKSKRIIKIEEDWKTIKRQNAHYIARLTRILSDEDVIGNNTFANDISWRKKENKEEYDKFDEMKMRLLKELKGVFEYYCTEKEVSENTIYAFITQFNLVDSATKPCDEKEKYVKKVRGIAEDLRDRSVLTAFIM